METKYSEYYAKMLKAAQEYQDFVCGQLHAKGVVLQNMTSKKYQLKKENLLGLEIKFDDLIKKTNRVYIETAEKAHPRSGEYAKSGIYRDDDSWLYGIGNYEIFYIFDNFLQCMTRGSMRTS